MLDVSCKRAFDIAVALPSLVIAAPILAALSVAIRVDSPGPIIFRHTRVGRAGKPIRTLKLRTMVSDADRRGPQITASQDPRITRVGRWLRKTKLDELPQLWNVVRGDMSIVGPRPEVPQYVAEYRPEWQRLLSVRPGLTDLASITFRDEESLLGVAADKARAYREIIMPMKLGLALEGIARDSVLDDIRIIMRTVVAIVRGPSPDQARYLEHVRRRILQLNEQS